MILKREFVLKMGNDLHTKFHTELVANSFTLMTAFLFMACMAFTSHYVYLFSLATIKLQSVLPCHANKDLCQISEFSVHIKYSLLFA